jgi:hypothetical protein
MTSSFRKASLTIGLGVCQGTLMSTKRTRMSLGCGDSCMVDLHLEAGYNESSSQLESRMILSRKGPWTRPWKAQKRNQSIRSCRLVMTKESSPMMMTHTGNTSNLQCQEVGRRKGAKEVVVIWSYSVALVWFVWFVSKRFVNEIIMIIIKYLKKLDYQRAW